MASLLPGTLPLVSARKVNNGYKSFAKKNEEKPVFPGRCLTINNDGDGGAGIAYYQPHEMLLDTHVTALYPKLPMSMNTMLFISTCITIQRGKFGHGYPVNASHLSVFRVMLPADDAGFPDWDFMSDCAETWISQLKMNYFRHKQLG